MFNFKLRAKLRKVFGANKVFLHGRCGTKNHSQGRILRGLALPEVAISQLRLATFRSSFRSRPFLQAMFPNGARRHFCSSKKKADDKSDSDYKSGGDKEDMPKKRPSLPMVFTTIYLLCLAVVASSMLTSRNSETARDLRRSTPVSFTKLAQRVVAGEVAKVVVVSNVTALAYSKDGQTVLSTSLAGAEQPERLLGDLQRNAGVPPSRQVPVFLPFLSQTDSPRRRVTADAGGCDLAGRARPDALTRQLFSAKKPVASETGAKLADVAGLRHAKQEVKELALFLREPGRFSALGARTPRGALLVGPPGTGKTLIAKAVAGEAGCSFFAASGSEFLEMFVGMGAARVRRLFRAARKAAPAIVFIDEVDAVGGRRSERSMDDERERTLNQLLVEMDGFAASERVLVLAGTNRADMLDRALLRPGRFDRRIALDLPDLEERREIFLVHLRPILVVPAYWNAAGNASSQDGEEADTARADDDNKSRTTDTTDKGAFDTFRSADKKAAGTTSNDSADASENEGQRRTKEKLARRLAALTPGFSGADIANVCNEGAIVAARAHKPGVALADFEEALDRVLAGLQRSRGLLSVRERRVVAHHEAGHAVAGWFLPHAAPLLKITIQPRTGGALGFAQLLPPEVALVRSEQLNEQLAVALGGRAAEQLFFGAASSGAADDLQQATRLAYSAVKLFGMSGRVGHLSFPERDEGAPRLYGDELAAAIDEEASALLAVAFARVAALLREKKEAVASLAAELLARETLSHDDLVAVLGERPFKSFQYEAYLRGTRADAF